MNPNSFKTKNAESAYASERLKSGRDDRSDREKLWADAELRGKIGANRANKVIAAIDGLKSWR